MTDIGQGLQLLLLILGKGCYPLEIAPPDTRLRCDARGGYRGLCQELAARLLRLHRSSRRPPQRWGDVEAVVRGRTLGQLGPKLLDL